MNRISSGGERNRTVHQFNRNVYVCGAGKSVRFAVESLTRAKIEPTPLAKRFSVDRVNYSAIVLGIRDAASS